MKYIFFIVLMLISTATNRAYEYLYPLAAYHDQEGTRKVLVLYQKSLAHIELWSWDPQTHHATKTLLSRFSPAGVRMLPGDRGFSFIDNGRIRIKEFIKRSPRSIDIYEPLHNIGLVTWNNDTDVGYFSAQERNFYRIFSVTLAGDVTRCITCPEIDCLYPCPIGSTLFYIERSTTTYRIVQQTLDFPVEGSFKRVIANFQERPIICLTMTSASEGFVIEHAPVINNSDAVLTFLYYHLIRTDDDVWQQHYLFSFVIPSYMLLPSSDRRLYESILPLVPRLLGRTVYYVDTDQVTHSLVPYKYLLDTDQKFKCFSDQLLPDFSFVPLCVDSLLFYGGRLASEQFDNAHIGPQMYFDKEDNLCFNFLSNS